jgi:hypothetical protein
VPQTIEQSFNKARSNKEKALLLKASHDKTRQTILQLLTPPASHQDPLRSMPIEQLLTLSDAALVHQALKLLTAGNPNGQVLSADGSFELMKECILEFAINCKTKDGPKIRRQLKGKSDELRAIADVQRFTKAQDDGDDIDDFFDDEFIDESSFDVADVTDDPPLSGKRKLQATLAGATVGKQQDRSEGKRTHKPTNRFGINAEQKDKQVLFATSNRTFQQNFQLLTVPGKHSQQVPQHVPVDLTLRKDVLPVPVFPTNVTLTSVAVLPLADPNLPTAGASSITTGVDDIRPQNTVVSAIAFSMSASPFAHLHPSLVMVVMETVRTRMTMVTSVAAIMVRTTLMVKILRRSAVLMMMSMTMTLLRFLMDTIVIYLRICFSVCLWTTTGTEHQARTSTAISVRCCLQTVIIHLPLRHFCPMSMIQHSCYKTIKLPLLNNALDCYILTGA